ncbi:MAG: ArnT family glycosyltransferase, partial [Polymorphobacter sp.]
MASKADQPEFSVNSRTVANTLWLAVLAAGLIAVNPVGYIGGHWDDGRYLESAQQWAAFGPHLGNDHWSLRSTVVLPTAVAIKMFGTTRLALMLPGLIMFTLLLIMHFAAVWQAFGQRCAQLTTTALLTSPILILSATRITADLAETLFWALALWAYWFAGTTRRHQRVWLIAAGFATGLAWITRETALGLCLILALGWLLGWRRAQLPRRAYSWIVLGFAV